MKNELSIDELCKSLTKALAKLQDGTITALFERKVKGNVGSALFTAHRFLQPEELPESTGIHRNDCIPVGINT